VSRASATNGAAGPDVAGTREPTRAGAEARIRELARERLGFESLRPGQLRAILAAIEGRDVLAVLPTGGGKSAIYELAGLVRSGPTVVVSPLISLQEDQVAHLDAAGLSAFVLNSNQPRRARAAALSAACTPDAFIFLSPEQLSNDEARDVLARARPGLFAVDEAHLISEWGHDFRTDYMRLGAQAQSLGVPVRIALTATAANPVRSEICRRLGLRDPEVVVGDFDRPRIHLSATRVRTLEDKHRELLVAAGDFEGPGIVYAATRALAEQARDVLASEGQSVVLYHAGLAARDREEAMAAFLSGSARIVVATVAFGMGIDKPDVRWVAHVDPPPSLDAYYQEIGRAGRDGCPAQARLIFRAADFGSAVHFTAAPVPPVSLALVARSLAAGVRVRMTRQATMAAVRLVDLGAATWDPQGEVLWTGALSVEEAMRSSAQETDRQNEIERSRLQMMRRYAERRGCRRAFLLSYFGQDYRGPCGNCDNDRLAASGAAPEEPFQVGERVLSARWGEGAVQRYDGEQMTVLFDEHGYRDLLVRLVVEKGLLLKAS
jgi:ATP-dependent DNA helicase RecQ